VQNNTDAPSEMIRMLDDQTVEVSLPNKLGYERIAMECSASFAKMVGFVPARIEDLKTAVSEACLNAIEHGNKGAFSVSVIDEGAGMPKLPKEPDIVQKIEKLETPRGLGVYLIKQLTDQVDFNAQGDGHVVRMVIKLTS
jgi:serine/threonine-protein kinase RsbW